MKEYKFNIAERRSRRATHEMVLMMAKHSNHGQDVEFSLDADVKRFFSNHGKDYEHLVEECRARDCRIPLVENLVGPTWTITGGAKVSLADTETDKESVPIKGPGTFTTSTYWQLFENATTALLRCLGNANFGDFQSCLSSGIASVEAYLRHRALIFNKGNPGNQLVDSKVAKVSLDDKIDKWIPIMTNGKRLHKGNRHWADFKLLRAIRDQNAIHPKEVAYGTNFQEFCNLLNKFRTGIAAFLIDLHLLFEEKIPAKIIRFAYLPDIEFIEESNA